MILSLDSLFRNRCYVLVLLLLCLGCSVEQPRDHKPDDAAIREFNRAVGLMGRFAYNDAASLFEALRQRYPDWYELEINAGIAILNRQAAGDEQLALARFSALTETFPQNPRAHYCRALVHLYLAENDLAQKHFDLSLQFDDQDAYAHFHKGSLLLEFGENAAALEHFQKSMALDPYFRSAYYGAFRAYRAMGQMEQSRAALDHFERLKNNPRGRLFEFKYRYMGPKAEVMTYEQADVEPKPLPAGPVFDQASPVAISAEPLKVSPASSLSIADINADGLGDLLITQAAGNGNLVYFATAEGTWQKAENHPLSTISNVNAVLWGDITNDGRVDAYFCRDGDNVLMVHQQDQGWHDLTTSSKTAASGAASHGGLILDVDQDGDLDLFVLQEDAQPLLLNNNGDGTFKDTWTEMGFPADQTIQAILARDVDRDRDTDLVFLSESLAPQLFVNDRMWQFNVDTEAFAKTQRVAAMVAADWNSDDVSEFYFLDGGQQLVRYAPESATEITSVALPFEVNDFAMADFNGDGIPETLLGGDTGFILTTWQQDSGAVHETLPIKDQKVIAWSPYYPAGAADGPRLMVLLEDGRLLTYHPGSGRHRFLTMETLGREDKGAAMRSNASGIGTHVALRVANQWMMQTAMPANTHPSQNNQPLMFGSAGASKADYVALEWTDGVFQTEMDLDFSAHHTIVETQRQLSSCPVIFAWNGEEYAFVSDMLGGAAIGFATGKDQYSTPRPWERFLMPPNSIVPQDDRVLLSICEPMEELAYIDRLQMQAFQVPKGWQMVIDERFATGAPQPTGDAVFYQKEWLPQSVINERDQDVTGELKQADLVAAPMGNVDDRFLGRMLDEQRLQLKFATSFAEMGDDLHLVIDGWVEYPYSQTLFAAWQAGVSYQPPVLEAVYQDGSSKVLLQNMGYPAGMPRRMSVPLPALDANIVALQIRTNLQVYWDRIALIRAEPLEDVSQWRLDLAKANLSYLGFPERGFGPQRQPTFDYNKRAPEWDVRYPRGYYPAFGDVQPLIQEMDDALLVIGPGETVELAFRVPQSLDASKQTYWVLDARGWVKDMDLYTKDGETVGPLPSLEQQNAKAAELHQQFFTRYQSGR